jgi:dihydrofolate reductase
MDILLIAVMAANRVIGRDGEIPWHIPEELRFFKETTMGHPLIMGRRTFASLPGPLPGRENIILSRDPSFAPPGTVTAASLKEGLDLCRGRAKVFIIGGAKVFSEAMPLATGIILSVLDREVAGDTWFPEISPDLFRESGRERHNGTEPFTVIRYRRLFS